MKKWVVVGSSWLAFSCAAGSEPREAVERSDEAVIFDADGRVDVHQFATLPSPQRENFQKVAAATAIVVHKSAVTCPPAGASGACSLTLGPASFNGLPLCSDQAFAGQQAMTPPVGVQDGRNCDAFLVAPNTMVSSGACFAKKDPGLPFECRDVRVVFGFDLATATAGSPAMVPQENVYSCKAVQDSMTFVPAEPTFSVFMLDRAVTNRTPLTFRRRSAGKLPDGTSTLAVAGHPLGLPLKSAAGAAVIDNTDDFLFRSTIDGDTGESGAPVFDTMTGTVEGVFTAISGPRFDIRTGGAPGGGDCLVWRACNAGSCDQSANANLVTRTSATEDNIVQFGRYFPPLWFGNGVAIAGPGSYYNVDPTGRRFFTANPGVSSLIDSDGDTLPDAWETGPVTVTVNGSPVVIDLFAMGADPQHKDVFLQFDWLQDRPAPDALAFQLTAEGQDEMRRSFENAPVWNPDGEPGIRLHLDAGPGSKTWDRTQRTWVDWPNTATASCGNGCVRRARALPYSKYFVSSVCTVQDCAAQDAEVRQKIQTSQDATFTATGRKDIFFYGIAVDQLWQTSINSTDGTCDRVPGSSEWTYAASGRNFGSGFLTSLSVNCPVENAPFRDKTNGCAPFTAPRTCTAGGSQRERAQTTQHELGHSFGLMHYGNVFDSLTSPRKPNYLSVMNYLFQSQPFAVTDYSRHTLRTLTESSLREPFGIHDPDGRSTAWYCPDGTIANSATGLGALMPASFPGAIDWNCSGFNKNPVEAPDATPIGANLDRTSQTTHNGWVDWSQLLLNGTFVNGSGAITDPPREATPEQIDELVTEAQRAAFAQLPTPSFKLTKSGGRAPISVAFDASRSSDLQGSISEYRWDFNDGTTAVTSTPTTTHVFRSPGTFVSTLVVKDNSGNLSQFPIGERVDVQQPAAPSLFGFEDPARRWLIGSTPVVTSGTRTTEGALAAQVSACTYQQLKSPLFNTTELQTLGTQISLDVFVPSTANLSNPSWVGDVGLSISIPAAGINNVALGTTQGLTTLPRGAFSTLTFPVSQPVLQALRGDLPEVELRISVNNGSCNSPLFVDNVRFAGAIEARSVQHREGSRGSTVVSSSLLSFENAGDWSSAQTTVNRDAVFEIDGDFSLAVPINGWAEVRSRAFSTTEITGETSHLSLDVFIPQPPPNLFWTGDVQVAFDCPSAGFSNRLVGSASLTNRFKDEFNQLSFTVPSDVLTALRGSFSACRFFVRLNGPSGAGTFRLDRLGFTP